MLRALVAKHGMQQWALIAQSMPDRNGKQCRERWHNQLDVNLTVNTPTRCAQWEYRKCMQGYVAWVQIKW
eukprot:6184265-Pleurochrysis_carterae.AAC.5